MKSLFNLVLVIILAACSKPSRIEVPTHTIDVSIDKLKTNDVALDKPAPGDWLAEHLEPGQTFDQYINVKPVSVTERRNKIYLQPIGELKDVDDSIISHTASYLRLFFELETVILPVVDDSFVPASARRINSGEEQLLAGYILNYLQLKMPEDAVCIMAITPVDLYPASNWNFVFGLARTKSRVGVSSFNRYKPDSLGTAAYAKCLERLIKTSSHEIAHMFTCQHCTNAVCVMNASNSMRESDSLPNRLCTSCLHKLQWNLGLHVRLRLEYLCGYYKKYDLTKDYNIAAADRALLN